MIKSATNTMKSLLKSTQLKSGVGFRVGLEGVSRNVAFGWALSKADPKKAAELEILLDGVVVGSTSADILRQDIAVAQPVGYRCGFRFDLTPFVPKLYGQKLTVREKGAIASTTTPLELHPNSGWGTVDAVTGFDVSGWAVFADTSSDGELEIVIDDQIAGTTKANLPRPDLRKAGVPTAKCGFIFSIPGRWHDGMTHSVKVRPRGSELYLRGGLEQFSAKIQGHIDVFDNVQVSGWLANLHAKSTPVRFDLWVNDKCVKRNLVTNLARADVESSLFGEKTEALLGFRVQLPSDTRWDKNLNTVRLCVPGSADNLLDSSKTAISRHQLLTYVEELGAQLNFVEEIDRKKQGDPINAVAKAFRTQVLPQLIQNLRAGSFEQPILLNRQENNHPHTQNAQSEAVPIDVIIPVYKGYTETLDCIQSAVRSNNDDSVSMEIVVINDHGPDQKLNAELRKLAAKGSGFTLLENEKNLGFVATVNRGMKLHKNRDVVLLNSDTVVPQGWLARMRRAAYSKSNIGTVTPFSNRATIFSLPRTCVDNDMALGLSVDELDTLCAERNPGVVVDVPTAVGFCMYIRRETLAEVGLFDEERWAKGYGEENDFCLRANAMGWRNVAACDIFVEHHGSVSFDTEKAPRIQENLAKLNALYPDYPQRVQQFLRTDPLAAPRGKINVALLKQLSSSYILFVTHGLGGGTEKAIRDLCQIHAKTDKKVLILRSTPAGRLELSPAIAPHEKVLTTEYPHATSADILAEHLRELHIEYVHFHHTLGFQPDIWTLPERLAVPYEVMIHDFYLVCPRINLLDDSGMYCGQPDVAACQRCVQNGALDHDADERMNEVGGTVASWRGFHKIQLQKARRVVAPSKDASERISRYFPDQLVEALDHPEPPFNFKQRTWDGVLPHKVAVLGAIGPHKGAEVLLACARYADRHALPIKFVVIGYTSCDEEFADFDNVEITGAYHRADLSRIIEETGCTSALFISIWPETFSYTLSEAWRHGLYPVAFDIGAPAERIREKGIGTVIPFARDPAVILPNLIEALEKMEPDFTGVASTHVATEEPESLNY